METIKVRSNQCAKAFNQLLKSGEVVSCLPQNIFVVEKRGLDVLDKSRIKYKKIAKSKIKIGENEKR